MENLLRELSVAMKPCEQAERIQKAHQMRKQQWVKQRRDEINEPSGKRRRTNHCAREFGVQESSSNGAHSVQAVVASTLEQPKSSETVHSDRQSNT